MICRYRYPLQTGTPAGQYTHRTTYDMHCKLALELVNTELLLTGLPHTIMMDNNGAQLSLQQAYKHLFQRLLAVEKKLGNKTEKLDNMYIGLATVNQQINKLLLSGAEQVCTDYQSSRL